MTVLYNEDAYDDGLYAAEVGAWTTEKHELFARYATEFATAMKNRWHCRVFIDLYSGPGLLKTRGTSKHIWGSAIHALRVKNPFDKYIFCDQDSIALNALESRVRRHFPSVDASFIPGNCDDEIEQICEKIPKPSKQFRVLSFCFVDPFDLSFKFATIKRLSAFIVDFLVLLALDMDANRAFPYYLKPDNHKLDDMLGLSDWRERWQQTDMTNPPRFLAEQFAAQMQSIGYLRTEIDRMKMVRADDNNRPLYRLALFSQSPLALKLWDEALKYGDQQSHFNW
jgi:three-Cys-motif partner protein